MNTLISVIVPIYNTGMYLEKCLDSICNQSYRNLEIILVNDGSTDNSQIICTQYQKIDTRIKYIEKTNGGLSSARNRGLDESTGQYLSFIDSDDYIDLKFIETLYSSCEADNVNVSMCGRYLVTGNEKKELFCVKSVSKWSSGEAIERLLTWNEIDGSVCDKLFHKNVFKGKRFPLDRISEDIPVLVSILCNQDYIIHLGEPLYFYVQRNDSITKQSFSPLKMSLLESANEVKQMVINCFPNLEEKALYYYCKHLLYLLIIIDANKSNSASRKCKIHLNCLLKKYLFFILGNNLFSTKEKIIIILQYFELYKYWRFKVAFTKLLKR